MMSPGVARLAIGVIAAGVAAVVFLLDGRGLLAYFTMGLGVGLGGAVGRWTDC